uniref:Uncharacterized protein n=1 Tax=Chromera velia CCMP2878 TaxID=1169474 RepID=A0A0G4FJM9_9ALVE|eukprot:Cvel_17385.t1-p1 / transcript=Cvel_17385.t1 / gene=Cvel_17385 / organism=Chromera_velia_CCMP2878 / gene_product=hypothetical protein / transcript_product=hypothetical protein / location=Cvel_scaffold1383:25305-26162(-) / protein_length=286 / sequence_SO=supercontig / SO=protein_coding / is_pseudo=false
MIQPQDRRAEALVPVRKEIKCSFFQYFFSQLPSLIQMVPLMFVTYIIIYSFTVVILCVVYAITSGWTFGEIFEKAAKQSIDFDSLLILFAIYIPLFLLLCVVGWLIVRCNWKVLGLAVSPEGLEMPNLFTGTRVTVPWSDIEEMKAIPCRDELKTAACLPVACHPDTVSVILKSDSSFIASLPDEEKTEIFTQFQAACASVSQRGSLDGCFPGRVRDREEWAFRGANVVDVQGVFDTFKEVCGAHFLLCSVQRDSGPRAFARFLNSYKESATNASGAPLPSNDVPV